MINHNIIDLDKEVPNMNGATPCSLLLALPHPGNPLQKAFLMVEEQCWGDGGIAFLSIKEYEEVPKLVRHAEATLYNLHGEDILDFFTPNGYNNAVEVEWDVAKVRVIPEGKRMARDATNTNDHDWITDQNLDELLGNDKARMVARPERETPKAQFDFDNDSHHTFGFGGGSHQMETSNETVDQDEEQEQMPSGNGTSATAMAHTFNMPPDEINPVSQCDESTLGNPTADSHMSQMEQRVDFHEPKPLPYPFAPPEKWY